jgi:hypothetical protein
MYYDARSTKHQLEYYTTLLLSNLQHTVQEQATFESNTFPIFYVHLLNAKRSDQHTTHNNDHHDLIQERC